MSENIFKVLALDGGGIRGVATAAYLADLESRLDSPLSHYVDLITGTSTGGIIAAALAREVPASEIRKLYEERGEMIFSRRRPRLPKKIASISDALYRSEPLHDELRSVLGENTKLGDVDCRVCIPAFNISTGRTVVFKTRHHEKFERDFTLPLWKVAAATAAAPIYFAPVHIPDRGYFVDGGIWANAPIMVGIAEGILLGYGLHEIRVLSIGTGREAFGLDGSESKTFFPHRRWGLWGWGRHIVDLFMRPQSQQALNLAGYILSDKSQILRIDFDLSMECDLDDIGKTKQLIYLAKNEAKNTALEVRQCFFDHKSDPFTPIPSSTKCD